MPSFGQQIQNNEVYWFLQAHRPLGQCTGTMHWLHETESPFALTGEKQEVRGCGWTPGLLFLPGSLPGCFMSLWGWCPLASHEVPWLPYQLTVAEETTPRKGLNTKPSGSQVSGRSPTGLEWGVWAGLSCPSTRENSSPMPFFQRVLASTVILTVSVWQSLLLLLTQTHTVAFPVHQGDCPLDKDHSGSRVQGCTPVFGGSHHP